MGRYNTFYATVQCRACQIQSEIDVQAEIGYLQWDSFFLGDHVFQRPNKTNPYVGPDPGAENTDFWAYGLGSCPHCRESIIVRIEVRAQRVVKIMVVPGPNPEDLFDFLNEWGKLGSVDSSSPPCDG